VFERALGQLAFVGALALCRSLVARHQFTLSRTSRLHPPQLLDRMKDAPPNRCTVEGAFV